MGAGKLKRICLRDYDNHVIASGARAERRTKSEDEAAPRSNLLATSKQLLVGVRRLLRHFVARNDICYIFCFIENFKAIL